MTGALTLKTQVILTIFGQINEKNSFTTLTDLGFIIGDLFLSI